jgi:rare lipoprotein A
MYKRIVAALVALLIASSATESMAHILTCQASWYSLPGQQMANLKKMNPNRITVAHKTLPLGSKVCITNLDNGVTLRNIPVTDRGPYIKGRCFDLSKAGAIKLGFKDNGTAHVKGWLC